MHTKSGPACFVVADAGSLKGLYDAMIAYRTSAVHVLDCAFAPIHGLDPAWQLHRLDRITIPATSLVRQIHDCSATDRSDRVRHALEVLHRDHQFDSIHFGVHKGLGFRSIQAMRAGLAFENVNFHVHPDTSSQRERERKQSWSIDVVDLVVDYMEKYSVEYSGQPDPHRSGAPLVTVGIAHHNLGEYLPAALESLAVQTYANIDVVVIDDGSTEPDSLGVFTQSESRYSQFRFLRQE